MFLAKLKRMYDQDMPALFEFRGRLYVGRIVAIINGDVLVEIEHNEKTVFMNKHLTAIEFITPTTILG